MRPHASHLREHSPSRPFQKGADDLDAECVVLGASRRRAARRLELQPLWRAAVGNGRRAKACGGRGCAKATTTARVQTAPLACGTPTESARD